jgi:hypothetical protein
MTKPALYWGWLDNLDLHSALRDERLSSYEPGLMLLTSIAVRMSVRTVQGMARGPRRAWSANVRRYLASWMAIGLGADLRH